MADETDDDQLPPWRTLVKSKDTSKLFNPLGTSVKIKYTCIAVSSRYVALGANTGGVYCFSTRDFKYLRLLTNKEGGASLARFSPDEETLAVAVAGGRVCFWELHLDEEHGVSKRFHVSTVLQGALVSDMIWDWRGTRLFFGDHSGRIAVAYLPKLSRLKFGTSSLFKKVDEVIHTEKSKIIQLDFWQSALLVSTTQRCCMIKLQWDSIDAVLQVGRKLRDGPFGACILTRGAQSYPIVYSARPGGRLWAADVEGTVLSTLKSKELVAAPPINILGLSNTSTSVPPLSLNFSRLIIYNGAHIVTWQDHALFLFNPFSVTLTCWTHNLRSIVDVQCTPPTQGGVARELFVLHEECRRITCLTVCTVEETLSLAIDQDRLEIATKLLDWHPDVVDVAMTTSDRVHQLVSTVQQTQASSPPHEEETVEETDLGLEKVLGEASDEDTEKEQEGISELRREETVEADLLAELDPESVGEGEVVSHQPQQLSEPVTIEEDKLTTGVMATSLPREIPVLPPTPTEQREKPSSLTQQQDKPSSLTQQQDKPSSLPSITTSSLPTTTEGALPPSILARMESSIGGAEKEHGDDFLVVRTKVNRKKQSKKLKKRRGSAPSDISAGSGHRSVKLPSELDVALLADITEHTPSPFTQSPSHSALSSSAASGESSPLSSSPKGDGSSGDKTPPNFGDPDDDPQQRSLSESVEGQARFGSAAALLSRVKSMAAQHGQGEAIQRPVKMMRDLISSLAPTPLAGPLQGTVGAGLVYTNYDNGRGLGEEGAGLSSPPTTSEGSPCLALSPEQSSPPSLPPVAAAPLSPSPPPSPVDPHTRDFIASVSTTRSELHNSVTVCRVESLQHCLVQWMGHLDNYRQHISSTEGPFQLPQLSAISEDVREEVNELVTLCLEVLVMEEEKVMEYVSHYSLLLDIPRSVAAIANMSKLSVMAACWRVLATTSEESLSSSQCEITEYRNLLQSRPQFAPAMMCRTYEADREAFISLCAQCPLNVAPCEVGVVCGIDQLASSGCDCHTFTRYLDHVMVGGARPHPLHREGLLHQPEVLLGALEAVLIEGAGLDMSHDKKAHCRPHHSTLQSLIKLCIDGQLSERALSLCQQYSYWCGYIELCSVTGRRREGLKAALSLGDISTIRELVKDGKLLTSTKDWQYLLEDLVKKDDSIPTVATGDGQLSWEELVVLMMECLGVEETGRMLLECEGVCVGREEVMVKVHSMIVELSSLQRQQRAVVHALLEKLDQYLWSQRPPALGPELMGVHTSEGVDSTPPTSLPSSDVYIEDSGSHWGVTVSDMRCGVCQCDIGTAHCNGVLVFHCGHAYHRNCLPEQACVLCFLKTNSLTLSFESSQATASKTK